MDATEIIFTRLNAKEVLVPKRGDKLIFSWTDGTVKLAGKYHEFRTSDHTRRQPEPGDEHRSILQGETDDPDPAEQHKERGGLEARHNFWIISGSFIYRHPFQQRVKPSLPKAPSQSRLNILIFSVGQIRHRVFCKKVSSMITGSSLVTRSYQGRGQVSPSSLYCVHSLERDPRGPGRHNENSSCI